ncbi:MAG: hypothetical protein KGZ82_01795 [Bacteroidales bacterium]|nr:hypothetical protein [Bacteroidales bacterium]
MNRFNTFFTLLLIAAATVSCQTPFRHNSALETLAPIEGVWEATGNTIFYEQWKLTPDSGYVGYAYSINNGTDTMFSEKLRIAQVDDSVYYQAIVHRQNQGRRVSFALVEYNKNHWVFENPAHDYPNRITYRIDENNRLYTRVENMEGKKVIEFSFRKINQ